MLVHLPISEKESSLKVFVSLPEGYDDYTMQVNVADGVCHPVTPEGVLEDEVEVTAQYTDHRSLPVGEVMVLKAQVEPQPNLEPEEEDEDTFDNPVSEVDPAFNPAFDSAEGQEDAPAKDEVEPWD